MITKIAYFGTPKFSAYILEELIKSDLFEIKTIVTSPDKPVGRRQVMTDSEVAAVAKRHSIPTLKPAKLTPEFIQENKKLLETDLIVVAAYGKIIPQSLLDMPKNGAINVHGSVLPKLRGASPIQQSILDGEKQTGVTIMSMDAQMDHGDILSTETLAISDDDTFESLSTKLARLGAKLLIKTIQGYLKGTIKPRVQNHARATYCPLIKKEDGYFDINNPPTPEILDRMIRAYYPWPNAWSIWNKKVVKFYPGGLVQLEGKKPMPLKDFLNGYPDFPLKDYEYNRD